MHIYTAWQAPECSQPILTYYKQSSHKYLHYSETAGVGSEPSTNVLTSRSKKILYVNYNSYTKRELTFKFGFWSQNILSQLVLSPKLLFHRSGTWTLKRHCSACPNRIRGNLQRMKCTGINSNDIFRIFIIAPKQYFPQPSPPQPTWIVSSKDIYSSFTV